MDNVISKADINETRELLAEAIEALEYLNHDHDFPDRKEWIKIQKLNIRLLKKILENEERLLSSTEVAA